MMVPSDNFRSLSGSDGSAGRVALTTCTVYKVFPMTPGRCSLCLCCAWEVFLDVFSIFSVSPMISCIPYMVPIWVVCACDGGDSCQSAWAHRSAFSFFTTLLSIPLRCTERPLRMSVKKPSWKCFVFSTRTAKDTSTALIFTKSWSNWERRCLWKNRTRSFVTAILTATAKSAIKSFLKWWNTLCRSGKRSLGGVG